MSQGTLLIIEDDIDIQDALRESLELEGYRVHVANDGLHAMQVLAAGVEPDLILLDLMMPGMDGRTFLREMRRLERGEPVPVIVITASQGTLPEGALKLIRKPFSLDHLLGQIRRAIRRRDPAPRPAPSLAVVSEEAL